MRPPRRSRRRTPAATATTDGDGVDPVPLLLGGRSARPRCGRWSLSCRTYSPSTLSRWRRPQISIQSRHSRRTVRTHRSANALAFGAWMGVVMVWMPSAAKTSSKARVNLLSRSRTRNRGALVPAFVSPSRLIESSRARWATHSPFGWSVTPARRTRRVCSSIKNKTYSVLRRTVSTVKKSTATMPEACARRNARQVTDPAEAPAGAHCAAAPLGWWWLPPIFRASSARPGCAGSPTWILSGQPQDQHNHIAGERRAPASRLGLRPLAGDQPAVPAQDRIRGDKEARPARARERAAQHRQERTVGGLELRSLDLAAQHGELVAEHGDLDVFGVLASQASKAACRGVGGS